MEEFHELNEARTAPDVEDAIRAGNSPNATKFLGWTSQQGEECGDFPMTEAGFNLSLVMKEVNLSVIHIRLEHMTKMPLAEHNNVVKAFPSDRADQSLSMSVLPWGTW
jgi:hypothetical protein